MGDESVVFNQINLVVRDMPAMVGFYERVGVEFTPTVTPWDRHHRTFASANVTQGFDFDLDSQAFVTEWNQGWPPARTGTVLGFRLASSEAVDKTYQELTAAGHLGQQPPWDGFMAARYAVVADPDGNSVGLMGPIDGTRARIPSPPAHEPQVPVAVEDLDDPRRSEPEFLLPEREMLEAWLEFHRTTLLLKCEGLDDARRKARPVPTSKLSLHGLVRHMAEVERNWFRRVLLDEPVEPIWHDPAVPDSELVPLHEADWDADLAAWQSECDVSRTAATRHGLDDAGLRHGRPCSLRWIYIHMIEEYSRHNGHADLIRELLDGAVGW